MRLVFVSSTFKDMQFERDELKNRVAPRIDSFLASYGENVHFGDLRWGVNTAKMSEEESAKKVLKVCLDEIDDCRPYMIVFIGERYGWIPSQELILEAAKIRGIENIDPDISVTNLEIEYGALLNPDFEGHILFYFRNLNTSEMDEEEKRIYEAESSLHKEKLDALKKTILKKYPDYVRYYDAKYDKETKKIINLNPVMDDVYNDLCRIFKIDLDKFEALPNYQRAIINSETRFEKLSKNAYRRKGFDYSLGEWNILENVFDNRYKNAPIMLDINGDAGSGKKTNLAIMYEEAKKDKEIHAYPFVVGLDEYTKGANELQEFIVRVLEDELGKEHKKFPKGKYARQYMVSILVKEFSDTKKHVRFFLMNCRKEEISIIKNIEANMDSRIINISFYVTYEQETYLDEIPMPYWYFGISRGVYDLEKEDKLGIIRGILKSKHKELPESVIKLVTTKEGSKNALYLSLIVERLLLLDHQDFQNIRNMGDGMVAIEKYMTKIVNESGNNIKDISKELLKELKERINPEMISIVLKLLSYDFKLTNQEIEGFFSYKSIAWDNVDYSLFMHSIPSLFKDSSLVSSYLEFKIKEIKEAVKELIKELGVKDYSKDIVEFLEKKDDEAVKKDTRLLEAYRCFDMAEKTANHYLNILSKIKDKSITLYERLVFKYLEEEYKNYPEYYAQVNKVLIDLLSENKVKNIERFFSCFYRFFDIYLVNRATEEKWANNFVETIGYLYEKHKANKTDDHIFFLLMLGIDYINYYFVKGEFDRFIYDDCLYRDSYEKACKLENKKAIKTRYENLKEQYKENGFHTDYLDDYPKKSMVAVLINALKNDKLDEYVEDYEDFVGQLYDFFFNEDEAVIGILENDNPDNELLEKDDCNSLIAVAAKFVIELHNEKYEEALEAFKKYVDILSKYRNNFYFFRSDATSSNMGPYLFSEIVMDYLSYIRVQAIANFPNDIQEEFESLYINTLQKLLSLMKLYLADHYEDTNTIAHYMDAVQSIMTYRPESDDNNFEMEEAAYDFSFIPGLVEWAKYKPNPIRIMVSYNYLMGNFIGYIMKDIELLNNNYINSLITVYWLNLSKDTDVDWYDSIICLIATYLMATKQTKKYDLFKRIYKEFYKDVYSGTYKEFKQDVKLELMEYELIHAKAVLGLVDDDYNEEDDE